MGVRHRVIVHLSFTEARMDRREHLRQGIWDGLTVLLLAAMSVRTALLQFDRIFLFCAVAGIYLILRFSYGVLADSRYLTVVLQILMAFSAVLIIILSGQIVSFLFLPFSLPAMRHEEISATGRLLLRSLLLPAAFTACTVSGLFRVGFTDGFLLTLAFGTFSVIVLFTERSFVLSEENHRREYLLLEKSVAETIAEREKRLIFFNHTALVAQKARQEERESLSRNIHNEVGHSITASLLALEAADVLLDQNTDLARQKIRTACARMRESLDGIRKAVRVMNETGCLSAAELTRRIEEETRRFSEDTDIIVRFHADLMDETAQVPSEHAEFLSGAVQELLSNGVRHGQATSFVLELIEDASGLRLITEDNGHGILLNGSAITGENAVVPLGFGLSKIRAYVEKFGGNLRIAPGEGFRVSIDLPVIRENI